MRAQMHAQATSVRLENKVCLKIKLGKLLFSLLFSLL